MKSLFGMYRSPHKRGGRKPLRYTLEAAVAGSRQWSSGPDITGDKYTKRHFNADQPRGTGVRGACLGPGKKMICYCAKNQGKGH